MIRRLRQKFILIASGTVLLVLVLVIVSANSISYYSTYSEIMSIIDFITENNGRMPMDVPHNNDVDFHVTGEIEYETRYFSMILDADNNIVATDYDHIAAVTDNEINTFYDAIINNNNLRGRLRLSDSLYFYRSKQVDGGALLASYSRRNNGNDEPLFDEDAEYRLIVFMDCTNRMYHMRMMMLFSILAGLSCFAIFVMIVSALSKRAIKPVIENYEKQKQFITNAGHELKTPLAIISANAEVIEAIDGKSEWTQSIINQVRRLSGLVNDLITLARLEEAQENNEMVFEVTDLSAKIQEVSDSFIPIAETRGKALEKDISEGIKIKCNEKSIHELASILIDNAVKYCDDKGVIKTELFVRKKQACLVVSNTYENGANVDSKRFFDRFYREDASHNQEKAGYGIGLSMAEGIVKLHKGDISASYNNGMISFTVTLPIN